MKLNVKKGKKQKQKKKQKKNKRRLLQVCLELKGGLIDLMLIIHPIKLRHRISVQGCFFFFHLISYEMTSKCHYYLILSEYRYKRPGTWCEKNALWERLLKNRTIYESWTHIVFFFFFFFFFFCAIYRCDNLFVYLQTKFPFAKGQL